MFTTARKKIGKYEATAYVGIIHVTNSYIFSPGYGHFPSASIIVHLPTDDSINQKRRIFPATDKLL
jgi:hypothetical protein